MAANFAKLPELRRREDHGKLPGRASHAVTTRSVWLHRPSARVRKFAADRLLSGDGSHLYPQVTHNFRDPTSGCYFNIAEIPRRFHVAAFRRLQCARAILSGKRSDYFSYSWNRGNCHLQKAFLFKTQRHCHNCRSGTVTPALPQRFETSALSHSHNRRHAYVPCPPVCRRS